MNEILVKEACNKAGGYYEQGYNCAEALFLTFREYMTPELSRDLVRMATPFGGGMGRSGCTCGAISGAMLIVGAARGRISADGSRVDSYDLAGEFHKRFKSEFGSACCRVLNRHDFHTPEQAKTCHRIIGNSAGLFMQMLQERDLV